LSGHDGSSGDVGRPGGGDRVALSYPFSDAVVFGGLMGILKFSSFLDVFKVREASLCVQTLLGPANSPTNWARCGVFAQRWRKGPSE